MWSRGTQPLWSARSHLLWPTLCSSIPGSIQMDRNIIERIIQVLYWSNDTIVIFNVTVLRMILIRLQIYPFLIAILTSFILDCFKMSWFSVVAQFYETRVIDEFVLRGNAVIMKCNLPSFVADFVYVEAWISTDDSEVEEYFPNNTKWGSVH